MTEWIRKADLDLKTAIRLSTETEFRDIVGFHAQQAVEKYLKALLTRHQIEFPKTHVIRRLLILLKTADPLVAEALDDTNWLSPFGAEVRYPGDRAETLPSDELRACELARKAHRTVMAGSILISKRGNFFSRATSSRIERRKSVLETTMRKEYDFSGSRKSPCANQLKRHVTIRLDTASVTYFKELAAELGMPYQNLINLFLRDCAQQKRHPIIKWPQTARKGSAPVRPPSR